MKKIENYKNVIIVVFICYVAIFSFLLIKQYCKLNQKLNTTIMNNTYELVSFDNFINEKKELLKKYEKQNNKNVSKECLDNISSTIDYIYFRNHDITTYNDLFNAYQYVLPYTYNIGELDKIDTVCNFSQDVSSTLWDYRFKKIDLIEREFIDVIELYQVTLSDNGFEEYVDLREFYVLSEIREIDKEYIEKIFEVLGEKYE